MWHWTARIASWNGIGTKISCGGAKGQHIIRTHWDWSHRLHYFSRNKLSQSRLFDCKQSTSFFCFLKCVNSIWLNTLFFSTIGVMLVLHLQLRLAMNLIWCRTCMNALNDLKKDHFSLPSQRNFLKVKTGSS